MGKGWTGRRPVATRSILELSLLFGTGYPPSPSALQNLENKRFKILLCARSLSLKELYAKSREHRSYGGPAVPFWERAGRPDVAMTVLSPRRGFGRFLARYPQLALWAAFFRRFAAQAGFAA